MVGEDLPEVVLHFGGEVDLPQEHLPAGNPEHDVVPPETLFAEEPVDLAPLLVGGAGGVIGDAREWVKVPAEKFPSSEAITRSLPRGSMPMPVLR